MPLYVSHRTPSGIVQTAFNKLPWLGLGVSQLVATVHLKASSICQKRQTSDEGNVAVCSMWYHPSPSISDMFKSRLSVSYMFITLVLRWSPTVHFSGSQGAETESSTSQALGVGRQDLKQDKRRRQRIKDWIQEPYLYIQDNQYSWNTFPVTFLTGDSVPSI